MKNIPKLQKPAVERIGELNITPAQQKPEEETPPSPTISSPPDTSVRNLTVAILIIIAIFALFLSYPSMKAYWRGDSLTTLDTLHNNALGDQKNTSTSYVYRGYSFVWARGLWYTRLQDKNILYEVPLHFGPRDLENITYTGKLDDRFLATSEVYITFNPVEKELGYVALAVGELSLNLAKALGVNPVAACDRNETVDCKNRPIMTCTNTNQSVIYFHPKGDARLHLRGNCIEIYGEKTELIRATDRLILQWYGIMGDEKQTI